MNFAQETSLPEGLVSQLIFLRTTYGISRGLRQESNIISKVQAYDLNIYLFWHMLGMASNPISILSMKSLKKLFHGISLPPEFTKKLDTSLIHYTAFATSVYRQAISSIILHRFPLKQEISQNDSWCVESYSFGAPWSDEQLKPSLLRPFTMPKVQGYCLLWMWSMLGLTALFCLNWPPNSQIKRRLHSDTILSILRPERNVYLAF